MRIPLNTSIEVSSYDIFQQLTTDELVHELNQRHFTGWVGEADDDDLTDEMYNRSLHKTVKDFTTNDLEDELTERCADKDNMLKDHANKLYEKHVKGQLTMNDMLQLLETITGKLCQLK
jgi:hypothetical protein